jgi:hypothetical protein
MNNNNQARATQPDPIETLTTLMMERFDHVDQELSDVRSEIRSLRRDVEHLHDRLAEIGGYAKEIDVLMDRVSRVEAHLGLNQEIKS